MADYMRNRRDDERSSENPSWNYYRRGSYEDQNPSDRRTDFNRNTDLDRGYSSYGGNEENYNLNRDNDNWRDERRSYSGEGMSRNFSGSNYDRDYDFGMNRRGYDRNYGNYGNMDYRRRDPDYMREDDRERNRGFGMRSNYAYNRAGYGSNFGGEYGHRGRNDYSGEFGGADTGRRGTGWAYGNPDERNYSSYSGRFDRNYEEAWERDNRDWLDRAGDEVASWFGNKDAEHRRRIDRWQDSHRGRGPKNYKRTDSRIEEDVNDRLSDDSWVDATDIEVKVTNGEVVLSGTVNDRFAKRRAEDIVETVSGVSHVENRLRVGTRANTPFTSGDSNTQGYNESNESKSRSRNSI